MQMFRFRTFRIVFKTPELKVDQRDAVETALEEQFKVKEFNVENISSTISGEMQRNAIVSVVIATILMLIYIAFRFSDVKFGAAAVVALLHDVLIVFAVYSIGRLSVGNTFIACMLTIVGYSINATIIIFDRIRENLVIMNGRGETYENIVNTSISQTLTRSIYTTLTTFVMIFMLYLMGVTSIKDFALTLMCGLICGAYSSVCITGPLWYTFKTNGGKKEKNAGSKKVAKKQDSGKAAENKASTEKPATDGLDSETFGLSGNNTNSNRSNKKKKSGKKRKK